MSNKNENILVIKLSALGDFIQALGPMKAIRSHHPKAKISLLTTKPFVELAQKSGYFDDIIVDTRPKFYQLSQWVSLRKKLNKGAFTRIYDLQNNDRTQIYFHLLHPKPEWVGVAKGASHRNTSPKRTEGLAFYGHVQTLDLAGINQVEIDTLDWMKPDISHLNLPDKYALIVAGSAPAHPEKRWPAAHYAAVCNALYSKGITPVLIGTPDEKDVTDTIEGKSPNVLNLNGKTSILDIVTLARNANFAVGNDTGPMHIIAPTGCKTVVLFSKNSTPKRHAPLGKDVTCIQENDLKNLALEKVLGLIS